MAAGNRSEISQETTQLKKKSGKEAPLLTEENIESQNYTTPKK